MIYKKVNVLRFYIAYKKRESVLVTELGDSSRKNHLLLE